MAKAVRTYRPIKISSLLIVLLMISAAGSLSTAQVRPPGTTPSTLNGQSAYRLGNGDEFTVTAAHSDELNNRTFRVSITGDVNFPAKVGVIHVAGMTIQELQAQIEKTLSETIRRPEVTINISQYRSQPVSVLGEVVRPQTIQLEGAKNLFEVMSMVGGPTPQASRIIIRRSLTIGAIPHSSATVDGEDSVAEINVSSVTNLTRPQDNIPILPNDRITVPKAEVVYALGAFGKQGGFALIEKRNITVLDLLVKAEGALPNAKVKDAKIIRQVAGGSNVEIPVNIKDVLNSKVNLVMQADDILYLPDSYAKSTAKKTVDTIIQMSLGAAIFRY